MVDNKYRKKRTICVHDTSGRSTSIRYRLEIIVKNDRKNESFGIVAFLDRDQKERQIPLSAHSIYVRSS